MVVYKHVHGFTVTGPGSGPVSVEVTVTVSLTALFVSGGLVSWIGLRRLRARRRQRDANGGQIAQSGSVDESAPSSAQTAVGAGATVVTL